MNFTTTASNNYGGYTTTVHTEFAFRIFINTGTDRQNDRRATHITQYNNTTKIGKNLYKYNYYMHHHHNYVICDNFAMPTP